MREIFKVHQIFEQSCKKIMLPFIKSIWILKKMHQKHLTTNQNVWVFNLFKYRTPVHQQQWIYNQNVPINKDNLNSSENDWNDRALDEIQKSPRIHIEYTEFFLMIHLLAYCLGWLLVKSRSKCAKQNCKCLSSIKNTAKWYTLYQSYYALRLIIF